MLLIKNGKIKPIVGEDIENGSILIGDDGKIISVGKAVEETADMTVIDAEGRLVTPGCVEAHCHIGTHTSKVRWEGSDVNEKSDVLTPHLRAIDAINPMDETFDFALQGGVTSACTGPGSAGVVAGTFAVIKLAGNRVDDMIVKSPAAMKCAFGENPKNAFGQKGKTPVTRMAVAALLRELLFKARNYLNDKEAGKNPKFDMKLEAMIPVMKKEIPLKAHAHQADDIFTAIRIAKEFDVNLTLDHCSDGSLIAEDLAKEGYPVFVGPSFTGKSKPELSHQSMETPGILHAAGLKVSIITDSPVTALHRLPLFAGLASRAGLPYDEAWKAITINPATSLGVGDRIGSLEPGKDGDVVIWEGDPLKEVGVESYTTIVDGKIVHSKA